MGRKAAQHSDTRARKTASNKMKRVPEPDIEADKDWRSPIDWNVPCWLEGALYPAPDALTPSGWAWEFLRRYPRYRAEWGGRLRQPRITCGNSLTRMRARYSPISLMHRVGR
jgi:hypothetical protein